MRSSKDNSLKQTVRAEGATGMVADWLQALHRAGPRRTCAHSPHAFTRQIHTTIAGRTQLKQPLQPGRPESPPTRHQLTSLSVRSCNTSASVHGERPRGVAAAAWRRCYAASTLGQPPSHGAATATCRGEGGLRGPPQWPMAVSCVRSKLHSGSVTNC